MASMYHPFDKETLYELNDDGNIRVTRGNGVGIFSPEGVHLSGEVAFDWKKIRRPIEG